MVPGTDPSAAALLYAQAYASHYETMDLVTALGAYDELITAHPVAPEAAYSRSQIMNIVNLVVPAKDLLAAHLEMVRRHIQRGED